MITRKLTTGDRSNTGTNFPRLAWNWRVSSDPCSWWQLLHSRVGNSWKVLRYPIFSASFVGAKKVFSLRPSKAARYTNSISSHFSGSRTNDNWVFASLHFRPNFFSFELCAANTLELSCIPFWIFCCHRHIENTEREISFKKDSVTYHRINPRENKETFCQSNKSFFFVRDSEKREST